MGQVGPEPPIIMYPDTMDIELCGQNNYSTTDEESETSESQKSKFQRHKGWILAGIVLLVCVVALTGSLTAIAIKAAQLHAMAQSSKERHPVILLSLDGFRYDYLARKLTNNLTSIANEGVIADFLRSQFPTKTFPNHYSIVTGLYPESHGIIANAFLSEDRKDLFRIGANTTFTGKWWGGEPIWVTAIKQGLKAASYFWVGSESPIQGIRPTYWKKYDARVPYQDKVKTVLDWLSTGPVESRPSIITMYHHEPDSTGHRSGTHSDKVNEAIVEADKLVGLLMNGLKERNLDHKVNLIILTDHGMADLDCSKVIYLDSFSKLEKVKVVGQGSFGYIYGDSPGDAKKVYEELKCVSPHLRVFYKDSIYTPRRMHHMNNKRAGRVSVLASNGWRFLSSKDLSCGSLNASHGYDNLAVDMRGIFIATGPDFKKTYHAGYFENTEIYNLLCDLLDLTPAPNNGTDGSLHHMLEKSFWQRKPLPKPSGDGNNFQECGRTIVSSCSIGSPCVCPWCSNHIKDNLTLYDKNLILSDKEISESQKENVVFGMPQGGAGSTRAGCLLTQHHYVTGYSKQLHIPLWVAYKLTKKQLATNLPRKSCYRRDPRISPLDSANCSDYYSSNYDRGHMAPLGDFNFERSPEQDTNVLTNFAPQHREFNRSPGLWFKSEELIRDWATLYGHLHVISGAIFDVDSNGIRDPDNADRRWLHDRKGGVPIPTHFYKILVRCLDNKKSEYKVPGCSGSLDVIAFILPHQEEKLCTLNSWQSHLFNYVATVKDIERLTGSLFFPDLPPTLQAEIKTKLPLKLWPYTLL